MENYIEKLFNLKDKVAVVVGGGGHICSEIVKAFAMAGCKVAILDIRMKKALLVENSLREKGYDSLMSLEIDVSKKKDHENCLKSIIHNFGKIDVLVNGAGIHGSTPFFDLTEEEWDISNSQIKGTFWLSSFGKHMVNQNSGSIINISSASASPLFKHSYSVSKAGIKNLTQNLDEKKIEGLD